MAIKNYRVGTTHFTPYTYDELMKVPMEMTEAHNKLEAENADLMSKAELLNYYISKFPDSRSAASYNKFMKMYEDTADKLNTLGLNNGSAKKDALELRKAYNSSIIPISKGIDRYTDAYSKAEDDNITDLGTLDDYVYNPTFKPNYLSGSDILNSMKDVTEQMSLGMEPRSLGTTPDNKYNKYITGYSQDEITAAFIASKLKPGTPLVIEDSDGKAYDYSSLVDQNLVNQINSIRYNNGYQNMTAKQRKKFDYYLEQGAIQGMGKVKLMSNPNYMSNYQQRTLQLREEAAANKGSNANARGGSGGGSGSSSWHIVGEGVNVPSNVTTAAGSNPVEFKTIGNKNYFQFKYNQNGVTKASAIYDNKGNVVDPDKAKEIENNTPKEIKPQVPIWETGDNDTPATTKMTTSRIENNYDDKFTANDIQQLDKGKKKYADASKLQGQLRKAGIDDRNGYYYRKGNDWYFIPKAESNITTKRNADIDYNAK